MKLQQDFERQAEQARKSVEETIATVAGELTSPEIPLAATLWAVASGTVTAAAHTVSLILHVNPSADVAGLRTALAAQLEDAVGQAVAMRQSKPPN